MPASRSSTPSWTSATHSPSAPRASAARAHGDRTVAVAVGLDDGPHRGGRDALRACTPTLCAMASRSTSAHAQRLTEPTSITSSASAASTSGRRRAGRRRRGRRRGPSARRPRPWIHAAGRCRVEGGMPLRQQRADDAGEHVAGARGGEPLVTGVTTRTSPAGSATTVAGPFSSTTPRCRRPDRGPRRCDRAGGRCPVSSAYSPSWGVSTVGAARAAQQRGRAVRVPRQREQPVAVDDDRQRRVEHDVAHRGDVSSSRPSPGPTTSAWKRSRSAQHVAGPAERRQRSLTTSIGADGSTPGDRQLHHPGAGPLRRLRRRGGRRPVMPGLPAMTRTAPRHLCAVGGRGRHHRATSSRSTRCARAPTTTSRPMSATLELAGQSRARREQQAGLERGERHRAVGGEHVAGRRHRSARRRRSGCRPRAPARRRRRGGPHVTVEPGAVRGVDHEVGAGQHRWARRHARTRGPCTPRPSRSPAGDPTVGAVVALPGDHVDHRPYVPPSIRSGGTGHRRTRPARSSTSTGSGAAASIARISSGRHDRAATDAAAYGDARSLGARRTAMRDARLGVA